MSTVFFPAKICQFDKTKNIGKKSEKREKKERKKKEQSKREKTLILAVKKTP